MKPKILMVDDKPENLLALELEKSDKEKLLLQKRLQQARKMEAIGTLSAGNLDRKTDPEHTKSIGIRGYLMKPVAKKDLAVKIRELLDEC